MKKYSYLTNGKIKSFEVPTENSSKKYIQLYAEIESEKGMFNTEEEVKQKLKTIRYATRKHITHAYACIVDDANNEPPRKENRQWNTMADLFVNR